MISKNIYINIVVRVTLIVLLSVLLGLLVDDHQAFRYSLICLITIIILIVSLINYLNITNRRIKFFFDSVRNDDSNLSFPIDRSNKTYGELSESMNNVNKQIQQLKLEIRRQEQYFQILLEHLATGIITYDNKGFVQNVNSTAKKLLSVEVLTHLKQIERIDENLFRTIEAIKPAEKRLVAIGTDHGEIQLSLKATSFRTNKTEMVILSIQDIKNELDEKELDSWMKLIRVLMHEIMNSITPITSLSESLSAIYSIGGEPIAPENITVRTIGTTLQGLNIIKEQGKGLMSFVESYRRLTRLPEPEKKLFRVSDLMSRVRVLFNNLDNKDNIELEFSIEDPALEIFADQNLVSQVLINLLKNALEASENSVTSKILISGRLNASQNPEICVIDNGPGIEKQNLDKIFVPFFTTRQSGSGIGLSISRQIMRAHGGNLTVKSVPGEKTVFCLCF